MQQEMEQASNRSVELQNLMETERQAFKREQQSLEERIVELSTTAANVNNDASARSSEMEEKEHQLQVTV
jgi:hypothetical protein